jgi:hypothetical protein
MSPFAEYALEPLFRTAKTNIGNYTNSELVSVNADVLIDVLFDEKILIPITNKSDYDTANYHRRSFGLQVGNANISLCSLLNINSLGFDLACILIDYISTQSTLTGATLAAILKRLIASYSHLNDDEKEVIRQFVGQAKKRGQSQYDAALHYEDLQKGFVDTLVPFNKTLNSLLNKGIIIKQDEDIYRLIR